MKNAKKKLSYKKSIGRGLGDTRQSINGLDFPFFLIGAVTVIMTHVA